MRKTLVSATLLAVALSMSGCSKSPAESPSDAEVEAAAREQFARQLSAPDISAEERKVYADALATARFAPKPQCVKGGDAAYACVVEMTATMPGDAAETQQPVLVELVKSPGGWKSAPLPTTP